MVLSPDKLPLEHSLRGRVLQRFAPADGRGAANGPARQELISYLAGSIDTDSSPLATIRRRAAREGRSADLAAGDHAVLTWISEAFSIWEERYPLESPLKEHLRKLQPLAVAVALDDPGFFDAGAHPLHRLLDALQQGAVGWQARLDRAGQMLEQRVERAVEKALEWFRYRDLDLAAITAELEAANERDAARAERMVQRLAETEEARLRTLSARRLAAQHINQSLAEFELPSAIGEFLRGPWFDSAQLLLVKHSEESDDWREMQRATRHLMESVQPFDAEDEVESDRRSQILRRLPGELRRWLLSLEHDGEATDSAIGLVEYAHLRMQHGQLLQRVRIPPLPVEDAGEASDAAAEALPIGQWYHFEDGDLRAQLVLQLDRGDHLLFTNFVGLKAIDLPLRAFKQRLADGFVQPLPCLRTFSICLASAAGVNDEDDLRALADPDYGQPASPPDDIPEYPVEAPTRAAAPYAGSGGTGGAAPAPEEELDLTLDIEEAPPAPTPAAAPAQPAPPPQEPPPGQQHAVQPPAQSPAATPPAQYEPPPAVARPSTGPAPEVPMGAWLGFHDGETPMMAKLAVYDPRRDNYILVNRKGIAMRELSGAELRALMDEGLVDVLEARSDFRDQVARAREEGQ